MIIFKYFETTKKFIFILFPPIHDSFPFILGSYKVCLHEPVTRGPTLINIFLIFRCITFLFLYFISTNWVGAFSPCDSPCPADDIVHKRNE